MKIYIYIYNKDLLINNIIMKKNYNLIFKILILIILLILIIFILTFNTFDNTFIFYYTFITILYPTLLTLHKILIFTIKTYIL